MAGDDGSDGAESALAVTREEARTTLERQLATLDDIDTKAAKILRLNVVIVGALLTLVSITVDADVGVSPFYNVYTVMGGVSLLSSTVFAALTYTASDVRVGLSGNDVRDVLGADYGEEELLLGLIDGYADWIRFNHRENIRNTPLITLTVLLLIYAVTAFVLGVTEALVGPLSRPVLAGVALALVAVTYAARLHVQIRQWLTIAW